MEEGTCPESEAESVGEAVGDGDGDELEPWGIVRDAGILEGAVSEFNKRVGTTVDPSGSFWSCVFESELKSV